MRGQSSSPSRENTRRRIFRSVSTHDSQPSSSPNRPHRFVRLVDGTMHEFGVVSAQAGGSRRILDGLLRGLSQVMIINNPLCGLFVLSALFAAGSPATAMAGVLGLLGSTLMAAHLNLDKGTLQSGLYGYNGVLLGLGLGTLLSGGGSWDAAGLCRLA